MPQKCFTWQPRSFVCYAETPCFFFGVCVTEMGFFRKRESIWEDEKGGGGGIDRACDRSIGSVLGYGTGLVQRHI